MEFKDLDYNSHVIEASHENLHTYAIKCHHEKNSNISNTINKGELELSVNIFDEPVCIKIKDVDEVQNSALSNQKFGKSKNLLFSQLNKNIEPKLKDTCLSKAISNANQSNSKHLNEYKDTHNEKKSIRSKMFQRSSTIEPSNIPFESTSLCIVVKDNALMKIQKKFLVSTNFLLDDNSTTLSDYQVWNDGNDKQQSLNDGEREIAHLEELQENLIVNKEENNWSLKKQKMSKIDVEIILDSNDQKIVNKQEEIVVSDIKNVSQNLDKVDKISTTSTNNLGVVNSTKMANNIKSNWQEKNDHNQFVKQLSKNSIGCKTKIKHLTKSKINLTSKKRKKWEKNLTSNQELNEKETCKRMCFQTQFEIVPTSSEQLENSTIKKRIRKISKHNLQEKRKSISNKIVNVEAILAAAIGFPKESLIEEEVEANVVQVLGNLGKTNYIIVRNHILAKWRENVFAYLEQDTITESIQPQYKSYVEQAYRFLLIHGYINFGVAPSIKLMKPLKINKSSVIIIGAGLAGLGAARQLVAFGHKVLVLEGRQRPGGRVYTKKLEGEGIFACADLGGSVITGIEGNPLGVLARQLNLPLHKIRDKCPLYQPNGHPVKETVDFKIEKQFNELLDSASKWRENLEQAAEGISLGATLETLCQLEEIGKTNEEKELFHWHLANLEYANAGLLTKLSLAFWDQDDPYEMGGDHCFLPRGNAKLINALAQDVSIKYGKNVHSIKYGNDGVKVLVGEEVYEADVALCTIPLGVLQRGVINFKPKLPQRKLDAIKRLGFGLLNKVVMLFPTMFWSSDLDMFGHLANNPNKRSEHFLFYSYAMVSEGPLLVALVAGEAAIEFEKIPPLQAVLRVMTVLRGIYEPRGINVPNPIQTVCTRWGSDFLSYGSYSNVAIEASGDDYDIMEESLGNGRLFFAGEATIRRYPATMHGAYLSGLREAGKITSEIGAKKKFPTSELKIQKDFQLFSSTLEELFEEPNLEFGSISIIFDHRNNDLKSIALLRYQYGKPRNKSATNNTDFKQQEFQSSELNGPKQQFHLYTIVTKQQAYELREVRGGDCGRLAYLSQKLGVKLVGRRGLGPQGDALVVAMKWH